MLQVWNIANIFNFSLLFPDFLPLLIILQKDPYIKKIHISLHIGAFFPYEIESWEWNYQIAFKKKKKKSYKLHISIANTLFSNFSSELSVITLFNYGYKIISHCYLNLHFPNYYWSCFSLFRFALLWTIYSYLLPFFFWKYWIIFLLICNFFLFLILDSNY